MAKRTPSTPPVSHSLSPMAARQRRLQAARLFAQGLPQAEVARRLEVSRQTASRWHARWLKGGRAGLAGPGRWGRPSRLSEADWRRVERAPAGRRGSPRVRHPPVDPAAGRRGDLAAHRHQLPPGACVVAAAPPWLEPAAAHPPRQRA
jgi:hypothetical protein